MHEENTHVAAWLELANLRGIAVVGANDDAHKAFCAMLEDELGARCITVEDAGEALGAWLLLGDSIAPADVQEEIDAAAANVWHRQHHTGRGE